MTLAEYLRQSGADEESIKALTEGSFSGAAKRAFDKLQADAAAAQEDAVKARKLASDTETTWKTFYENEVTPKYTDMQNQVVTSTAELARAKAAVLAAQEQGLSKVAEQLGWKTADGGGNPPSPAAPGVPANFDASKFVSLDQLNAIAEREGDAIAIAQDIAAEHALLFPGQRLNMRDLRKEAVARRISVMQMWEEKFGVAKARADAEAARQKAHDDAIAKQARDAAIAEMTGKYANPETRPLAPSSSPFTHRAQTGRDKQPWERTDDASRDRVARATQKVLQTAAGGGQTN